MTFCATHIVNQGTGTWSERRVVITDVPGRPDKIVAIDANAATVMLDRDKVTTIVPPEVTQMAHQIAACKTHEQAAMLIAQLIHHAENRAVRRALDSAT